MKQFLALILCILTMSLAKAQEMKVESMETKPFEIIQSDKNRYDLNNNKCAMVRVSVKGGDFTFSGNIVGDIKKDGADYIVYMSPGSKNIQIKHPLLKTQIVNFNDFDIEGVKGGAVYVININISGVSKDDIIKAQREEAKNDPDIGGFDNGFAWVDLGLPSGNRWAAWNVGAYSPKELGEKFMWAQRFSSDEFTEENYAYADDFMEIPDFLGNPDHDCANSIMGMNWRMPLKGEFKELIDNCVWNYYSDQNEFKVTGPNGKSIYFMLDPDENFTGYWSSSHAEKFNLGGMEASDIAYLGLGASPEIMCALYPYNGNYVRAIYDPYPIELSSDVIKQSLPSEGTCDNHKWMDLGLSVNWATSNIGAANSEEAGIYFAWGNPKIKTDFTLFQDEISNFEDPASIHWSSNWRMPTYAEFCELRDKCQWNWTGRGYKITGSNGNSIFLPAAGMNQSKQISGINISGNYWSSLAPKDSHDWACNMSFVADKITIDWYIVYCGLSIRPVIEKKHIK